MCFGCWTHRRPRNIRVQEIQNLFVRAFARNGWAGIIRSMTVQSCLRACLLIYLGAAAKADEGMWLFNDPPKSILKDKYNFDVSSTWMDHLQKASVRFNNG